MAGASGKHGGPMGMNAREKHPQDAGVTIRRLTLAITGLLVIVIAGAALLADYREAAAAANEFEEIALLMEARESSFIAPITPVPAVVDSEDPVTQTAVSPEPIQPQETQNTVMLEQFSELYSQNDEIGGWVSIDGTKINYPVMFTPDNPEKYLQLSFTRNYSVSGVPFIGDGYSISPRSDNIVLYGHHMQNGTMFAAIVKYEERKFWQNHPVIYFSTLYEEGEYEVFAAIATDLRSAKKLRCYTFVNAVDEADFQDFISRLRAASFYDTDVEVNYGDDLLTLSTCAYHTNEGRFIIVARRKGSSVSSQNDPRE